MITSCCAVGFLESESESDRRFYEGLRKRGLFSLVESELQDQLAAVTLTPEQKDFLKLELSRTYVAHAGQRIGAEQEELWELAQKAAESASADDLETKWSPHLQVQETLVPLAKSRFRLHEFRMRSYDNRLRQELAAEFHAHLKKLRSLEASLNKMSNRVLSRFRDNPQALSPYEFRNLQKRVILEVAQVLSEIAEVEYHSNDARRPAIRAATERAKRLIGGAEDEAITWQARVLMIRCERLQGEYETARSLSRRYSDDWPIAYQNKVLAEEIRIDLQSGHPELALERLQQQRQATGFLTGQLTLLHLKTLSQLWEVARQRERESLADELYDKIREVAGRAQTEVGGIWGWRSQTFVESMKQAAEYGPEIADQVRIAQSAYSTGKYEDASTAYRKAVELAESQNRPEIAAEMMFTIGSILLQQKKNSEAQTTFRDCVDLFPETERAADCHLMWTWCVGTEYRKNPTKSHRLNYTNALDEHLKVFPSSPTRGDAHLMYGQFQENRLQVTKAVEHYLTVPREHAKAVEADRGALRCYQKILSLLREQNRSTESWRDEAISQLNQRTSRYPAETSQLKFPQCQVLVSLTELKLEQSRLPSEEVIRDLDRVLECAKSKSHNDSSRWESIALAAYRLKVVSLAQSGKSREAEALVSRVATAGTKPLLELLNGLTDAASKASPETRTGIAELQLKASQALNSQRSELSDDEKRLLDRSLARAYLHTDRSREAYEMYETLLAEYPDDIPLRRELANSLDECGSRDCLQKALKHWKYLEGQSRQGSQHWLRLRAEVIETLIDLGQQQTAVELLSVTELLYSQVKQPPLESKYSRLKEKLDREN